MKTLLALSILFFAITLPLHSDTSENAIETDIVVIKTEIQNLNENIDDKFDSLEKRFNGIEKNFDDKLNSLEKRLNSIEKNFDDKFDSLEKRFNGIEKNFDRQNAVIIACIAIPMALITLLIAWRSVKDNSLQRQIRYALTSR